jgi:hypothetical protein
MTAKCNATGRVGFAIRGNSERDGGVMQNRKSRSGLFRWGLLGAGSVLALGLGLPAGAAPVVHDLTAAPLGYAVIKIVDAKAGVSAGGGGVSAGGSVGAGGAGVSAGADAGADAGTGDTGSTGGTGGDTSGSGDTGGTGTGGTGTGDTGTGDTGTGGTGTGGTGTGDTGTGGTGTGGTGTSDTGTGGTGTGGTGTGDTGSGGTDTGGTDTGGTGGDSGGATGPSVAPSHATLNRSDVPQNSPLSDRPAAIVDVPTRTLQPALIPSDNCISGAAPCPMGSGQVGGFSQPPSTLRQGASGAGNGAVGLSASTAGGATPQPAARTSEGLGISLVDPVRSDSGLLVQGVIVNLSSQARPIPPMRVELLNSANQVVQRSLVRAPVGTLAGGEHRTFKTLVQPLPPNIARVSVAFIPQQ